MDHLQLYNSLQNKCDFFQTFLPRLEELMASHNRFTILDKDFHGLPVLCYADLGNNRIYAVGRELVSKTRCKIGHGVHEGTWDTLKIDMQGK